MIDKFPFNSKSLNQGKYKFLNENCSFNSKAIWCFCITWNQIKNQYHYSDDSLTIHDGGSDASPVLGKYCEDSLPLNLISSRNQLFLKFKSLKGFKGFKLEYKSRGELFRAVKSKSTNKMRNNY